MASRPPKLDRARVLEAFQKARLPDPPDELVEGIGEIATAPDVDEPPYNQFYDDDLRKAYAHFYRLLLNRVPRWQKILESLKGQTYPGVEDDKQELEDFIRDAEIAMKLSAFYHRMSARNQQGKNNVKGKGPGPDNAKRLDIIELMQVAGYTQAEASRVALDLIPYGSVLQNPKGAFRQAIKRQKRKAKK
jgi:hypothetical protein